MNKIILTGNLTRDPELRRTGNGTFVGSGCVAVSRERKEPDGTYGTDFINIVVWGQTAEYLAKYGRKGDKVELSGRLEQRKYENRNGATQTVYEVIVESLNCFSKKEEKPAEQEAKPVQEEPELHQGNLIDNIDNDIDFNDDDLPF